MSGCNYVDLKLSKTEKTIFKKGELSSFMQNKIKQRTGKWYYSRGEIFNNGQLTPIHCKSLLHSIKQRFRRLSL